MSYYLFTTQLIADEEDSERRTQAKAMSEDKRQKRLAELKDSRQQWRESGKTMANEEEQLTIFHVSMKEMGNKETKQGGLHHWFVISHFIFLTLIFWCM